MKKLFLGVLMLAFGFTANAQGDFNLGVNFGIPTGDASDITTFNLGLEANYLFEAGESFQIGPSISYSHFFGDSVSVLGTTVDFDDVTFLPIAAAARFAAGDSFTLGADLGYAIGISDDGGFYYRPMIGYDIGENFMLQATYSGISLDGGNVSSIGLGAVFGL
jgi:hypothetical protein